MAKKASTGKTGSGSQDPKGAPGEHTGTGGDSDDEEEEEDSEEGDDSKESKEGEGKQGEGKQGEGKGKEKKKDELDLSTLPQETQDYIKRLRRESAKYRTKAANLETNYNQLNARVRKVAGGEEGDDEVPAEERLAQHEQATSQLAFDNAVLNAALQHGVGGEGLKYFRFLVNEKASELGEGEELSDEDLADIAEEARKTTRSGRTGARTSVTGDEGGKGGESKKPAGKETVNLDQFAKMSVYAKSELQKNNPELYAALFQEAVAKRRLV